MNHRDVNTKRKSRSSVKPSLILQSGLSLIELMVAILIGLIAVSGAIQALQISQKTQRFSSAIEELNEYGRFAMMHLRSDLRNAGDNGCPSWLVRDSNIEDVAGHGQAFVSTIEDGNNEAWFSRFYRGIEGFSFVPNFLSDFDVDNNSDILVIHRTDPRRQYGLETHIGNTLTLNEDHDFDDGSVVMSTTPNCTQASIFIINSSGDKTLDITTGGGGTYTNCSTELRGESVACTGDTHSLELDSQSTISDVVSAAYYIDSQTQQLMRLTAGDDEPMALVNGVSAMTLRYGLDSDNDGVSNQFYEAEDITSEQWSRVISVDVAIVLESDNSVLTAAEASTTLSCGSVDYGTSKKLRSCYTSRVNIRSRGGSQI